MNTHCVNVLGSWISRSEEVTSKCYSKQMLCTRGPSEDQKLTIRQVLVRNEWKEGTGKDGSLRK